MSKKYLVLGVSKYRFVQDDTGQIYEGVTVYYCDSPTKNSNKVGIFPMKITGNKDLFDDFSECPAFYDMEFSMSPGMNQKPNLSLYAVNFSESLKFPVFK